MANIKLEVTIENVENSDLDGIDTKLFKHLAIVNKLPSDKKPFPGQVTDVQETERDEDEEDDNDDN
jgi:hypothetical protein